MSANRQNGQKNYCPIWREKLGVGETNKALEHLHLLWIPECCERQTLIKNNINCSSMEFILISSSNSELLYGLKSVLSAEQLGSCLLHYYVKIVPLSKWHRILFISLNPFCFSSVLMRNFFLKIEWLIMF